MDFYGLFTQVISCQPFTTEIYVQRPVNAGFVVDKVSLGEVLLQVLHFLPVSIMALVLHIHSINHLSPVLYNLGSWQHR